MSLLLPTSALHIVPQKWRLQVIQHAFLNLWERITHSLKVPFVAHTTQTCLWSLWYSNTTNYWWLFLPSTWIITTPARDLYINAIMSPEIGHISTYLLKARDTHFSSHLPEVHFPVWSAISTAISCEGKEKKKTITSEFRAISDKSCYIFLDSPQSASEQQPCWKVFNAQNLFWNTHTPQKKKRR